MKKTTLLKQLLFIPLLVLLGLTGKSQVFSESFDSPTFPPAGWTNTHTFTGTDTETPSAVWEGAGTGAYQGDDDFSDSAFIDPHSGSGMAGFRSYDFRAGNGASLASPAFDLSSAPLQIVSFWIYRDGVYSSLDSVSVYINTTQNLTGATFLGKAYRFIGADPAESGAYGWYRYSFSIPSGFNTATNYLIFHAVSDWGNNTFIDDVVVEDNPVGINGALVDIVTPADCNVSNDILVKLKNNGTQNITAGAATVALYVTGANPQGPLTQSNAAVILPGDTATLTFTGSFTAEGLNIDSAFIQSLAGDLIQTDDTLLTAHLTSPASVNAPYAEDFEGGIPGWTVNPGSPADTWGIASAVQYPAYTPAYVLDPKSGSNVALFNSYTFPEGTIAKLSSNCINIPAGANSGCGYAAGFYFTQDPQYLLNQDSVVVKITADGGNSYSRLGVVKRLDSAISPTQAQAVTSTPEWRLYTFDVGSYAGQTVQFAFDGYSSYGNQMAIDSFFVGPKTVARNVALASASETGADLTPALTECTDAGGWTYYSDDNSARYLFGIQWDPSSTGANTAAKAAATAKVTVDRKWYSAENTGLKMATYTMQRYWDVDLNGSSLEAPVNVRFFYSQREFDSIIAAKDRFIAANPGAIDEGFRWFKTLSAPFVPSPASVNYDSVVDDLELQNINVSGTTINGTLYAQFNGITSFSGGTAASGVGPSSPLPVGLLSFTAQRTGRVNKVTWSTSQEINTSLFIVERSTDGRNYSPIGQLNAAGNSSNNLNYSFIDFTPFLGINYYRLRIVDNSNHEKFSAVKNVRNEGTADVAVYPNPVKDIMLVNITSDNLDKVLISITDMNGKTVYTKSMSINEGINYINVNTANISRGTYIIKLRLNEDMIVRKFNKL